MALVTERAITTLIQGSNLTLGVQNPVDVPRGTTFQAVRLRLTGTLTVGVAVATILENSPLGLLRSVDLLLGGRALRVHDARAVRMLNKIQHRTDPRVTAPSGAIGASAFNAETVVDLWQPDLLYGLPRSFWLDSRFINGVRLVATIGQAEDVATAGGGGTVALSSVQLGVDLIEVLDRGGILSRMEILRATRLPVAATGRLDVPPYDGGGVRYRAFLIHATSGNADENRATSDDTIITDVSVRSSRGIRYLDQVPWERLRNETKRVYNLETVDAGWALVDFAKEHHLDDHLDSRGSQAVNLSFTIGAAPANSIIQVYPLVILLAQRRGAVRGARASVVGA